MVIRGLPVLTGDGLTWAETFLDIGMHLTPSVTPTEQWRPVTGATYMAASTLMQISIIDQRNREGNSGATTGYCQGGSDMGLTRGRLR